MDKRVQKSGDLGARMNQAVVTQQTTSPALDRAWLKDTLSRHLWHDHESGGEIVDLEIIQAWDSRKNLTVLYELSLREANQPVQWQTYVGYQPKGQPLQQHYQTMLNQADSQPPVGRAVTLVPEANLIMVAFPNDRKMRLLSESEVRSWVDQHFEEIIPKSLGSLQWQIQDVKLHVLRYVPNKRITSRCLVTIKNGRGRKRVLSFILKQFSDSLKAKRVYHSLNALQTAMAETISPRRFSREGRGTVDEQIRIPREIALDKSRAFVLMEDLPGEELKEVLSEVNLPDVMQTVGALLARFHQLKKSVAKHVSIESEVAEIQETLDILQVSTPSVYSSADSLLAQLKRLKWKDNVPAVLLHGSFRLNHILIHQGELALLDLDSLRLGHPAYDIANFLSSLYYFEIQGQLQTSVRKEVACSFLTGYARSTPWPVTPVAVLWFLASLLINKQVHKYVTHFHEDQGRKVLQVLDCAKEVLQKAENMPESLVIEQLGQVLP